MKLQLNAQEQPVSVTLITDEVVIVQVDDVIDLLGNARYLGAQKVIAKAEHFCADFFDLRCGLAGEMLQKFANYRMQLTILGNWQYVDCCALQDFIRECNRGQAIAFQ